MKITANENDANDMLQTFRQLLLSSSVHCTDQCIAIVFFRAMHWWW